MPGSDRVSRTIEVVSVIAVVVSLMYVAREIRQNTAAIHAASGQAAYEMHQARISLYMENESLADLAVRIERDPSTVSPADSLRWFYDLNLRINLLEMVHANLMAKTMDEDMAESWLALLDPWTCVPMADHYWARTRTAYTPAFVARVDAAFADPSICASDD